ncbi:S41 family peptidase [Olivibacter sitiensis]|uniref:S41 family peptidase n=1 Tax=Olivibacter sitiensis TaxID=376470 RepID=UPI00040BB5AA|nr:S41 family peptidase [Olivibacter sitiensis]
MRPETRKNLLAAATYAFVLLVGLVLGQIFVREDDPSTPSIIPLMLNDKTGKLQRLVDLISERYVEVVGIDTLQEMAVRQVLSRLDPHSTYLTPSQARSMDEALEGTFDGIGVEYYRLRDTLMIVSVTNGGPAEKAGIKVGDRLIGIDNLPIVGANERDVSAKVRGKRGSTVRLWINRKGQDLPEPIQVKRDKILVSSIEASYIIDTATAYIKIKRFGARTHEDFDRNIKLLKQYGVRKLILDLRGNSGGFMMSAVTVADQFFSDKQLLVYTQGAHEQRVDYHSNGKGLFTEGKLAVLIDEKSASASEILAGAVQDLDRGVIVGRRSFGKGLVQEQFDFDDGSAINLTIAKYYTPSGRCIQRSYANGRDQYFNDILWRNQGGGEFGLEGVLNMDSLNYQKGIVYRTTMGRPIFGGGGIMPDVYVPVDTLGYGSFYKQVLQHDLISSYVYSHLVSAPPDFAVEHFMQSYELPEGSYSRFVTFAEEQGVEAKNKVQVQASRSLIEANMKALVARYFFGSEAYFKIMNGTDHVLNRTVEIMRGQ